MAKVYFATCDGTQHGRVTGYHRAKENALAKCDNKNRDAAALGVKARYTVAEIDETAIPTIQTEAGPKTEIPVN